MRISEVSDRTQLPVSTLRYYERRGILRPMRSPEGYREYREQDLSWIAFVQRLLGIGMSLAQVEEYSRLREHGDSTIPERLDMLYCQREQLTAKMREVQGQMDFIDRKIDIYRQMM
ncbi:MerR family transcriptional regulator [Bombiscardovia coagulans]|uniref:MerR family transcriptional regulator n=1 Tax=Bombiscardovia coagulans TaxID=686666 RepID=A0A261EQW8_9BIFI|nr:MerR family transcriptional regulator [Bombiscardovia coagulans]OZG49248.1 MerR family transcriptional regulator [Bombiscardovia coagulans]